MSDLQMNVIEIRNSKATLDGGDVLFTGTFFSFHSKKILKLKFEVNVSE